MDVAAPRERALTNSGDEALTHSPLHSIKTEAPFDSANPCGSVDGEEMAVTCETSLHIPSWI